MWFKVFIGSSVEDVIEQGNKFAALPQLDVKSVGVEYVESQKQLVLSLGFDIQPDGVQSKLVAVDLGHIALNSESVEAAFQAASTKDLLAEAVICHEFFIDHDGFHLVLLVR